MQRIRFTLSLMTLVATLGFITTANATAGVSTTDIKEKGSKKCAPTRSQNISATITVSEQLITGYVVLLNRKERTMGVHDQNTNTNYLVNVPREVDVNLDDAFSLPGRASSLAFEHLTIGTRVSIRVAPTE
ncbi:MAG: hypothetical protein ACRD63_07930, partial [Pyrinomonadaceae bacterium]